MVSSLSKKDRLDFFKDFEVENPVLILGLIIITLGLYTINWIYVKNKSFEGFDADSPSSKRGIVILTVLPFLWFFIYIFILNFFNNFSSIINLINKIIIGILSVLILKYLYDFCISFEKFTESPSNVWFISFFFGLIGLISIILDFIWTIPLIFFGVVVIPAMQGKLNSQFFSYSIRSNKKQ